MDGDAPNHRLPGRHRWYAVCAAAGCAMAVLLAGCGQPLGPTGDSRPGLSSITPATSTASSGAAVAQAPVAPTSDGMSTVTPASTAAPLADAVLSVDFANGQDGWIGGAAGIYGTADGGETWMPQESSYTPVDQIDFVDAQDGWAVVPGRLLETRNGGHAWSVQPPSPAGVVDVDFVGATQGWAITGAGALYATADGGGTWAPLSVPVPVRGIDLLSPTVGWAAGGGEILTTRDGGATWSVAETLPGAAAWGGRAWFASSPTQGWALLTLGQGCASQEPYLLYGTSDRGAHWQLVLTGPGACNPSGRPGSPPFGPGGYPSGLWAAGANVAGLAVNSRAGSNLQLATVGVSGTVTSLPLVRGAFAVSPAVDFVTSRDGWIAASTPAAGALWHSVDGGASWQEVWAQP